MAQADIDGRSIRERMGYSVEAAGRMIGLSRSAAYKAAQAGVIPARRIGLRVRLIMF